MQYLHSTDLGSHGRLKSANCLIDNKWTVKITGEMITCFDCNCLISGCLTSETTFQIHSLPKTIELFLRSLERSSRKC